MFNFTLEELFSFRRKGTGKLVDAYEQQQQRIEELGYEINAQYNLITRQSEILTKTANALKGEPEELSLHSHHDLMDVAHKLVRERDHLSAVAERLREDLKSILGWRELRNTRAIPIERIEEIARIALESTQTPKVKDDV